MELLKKWNPRGEFSPEFKREFVEKILVRNRTLSDLAGELGVPPQLMRQWTRRVEDNNGETWQMEEPLPPAIRILELEHDLNELKREVQHQAITIRILESKQIG